MRFCLSRIPYYSALFLQSVSNLHGQEASAADSLCAADLLFFSVDYFASCVHYFTPQQSGGNCLLYPKKSNVVQFLGRKRGVSLSLVCFPVIL